MSVETDLGSLSIINISKLSELADPKSTPGINKDNTEDNDKSIKFSF